MKAQYVWVLVITIQGENRISAYSTEYKATEALERYAKSKWWDTMEQKPHPKNPQDLIDEYFEAVEFVGPAGEQYSLLPYTVDEKR